MATRRTRWRLTWPSRALDHRLHAATPLLSSRKGAVERLSLRLAYRWHRPTDRKGSEALAMTRLLLVDDVAELVAVLRNDPERDGLGVAAEHDGEGGAAR
jgi:hypothetical protein